MKDGDGGVHNCARRRRFTGRAVSESLSLQWWHVLDTCHLNLKCCFMHIKMKTRGRTFLRRRRVDLSGTERLKRI